MSPDDVPAKPFEAVATWKGESFHAGVLSAMASADRGPGGRGTVDISQIPLIRAANQRLLDAMDNRTFFDQFATNLAQLETLGCEIVDQSGVDINIPFRRASSSRVVTNAFETVFSSAQENPASPPPIRSEFSRSIA